jgi:hypothetical protein
VIDHGVHGARHLGRDCGVGLAAQMGIVSILRDVAVELVPKAVGPLGATPGWQSFSLFPNFGHYLTETWYGRRSPLRLPPDNFKVHLA